MLTIQDVFEALSLAERDPQPLMGDLASLHSWREGGLESDDVFALYLHTLGWSETELRQRLASKTPLNGDPQWLASLRLMLNTEFLSTWDIPSPRFNAQDLPKLPLAGFYLPFLSYFRNQVRVHTEPKLTHLTIKASAYDAMLSNLATRLLNISLRALIQYFSESHQTYQEFADRISTPSDREAVFRRFPVLARDVENVVSMHINAVSEILLHLDEDFLGLVECSMLDASDKSVVGLDSYRGDTHRNGRSVSIVNIGSAKLVYRPNASSGYALYRTVAQELSPDRPMRCPQTFGRVSHIWVEYVPQAPAASVDPSAHFEKMGTLAAIAFGVGATDLHMENVIAATDGPIPIDLETLLGTEIQGPMENAYDVARQFLNESPLGTGVLPLGVQVSGGGELEISALCGGLYPTRGRFEQLLDPYSDNIRIQIADGLTGVARNLPPDLDRSDLVANISTISDAFNDACDSIWKCRDIISAAIADAGQSYMRVIVRPTNLYDIVRRTFCHPRYLTSSLARERFLHRLWKGADSNSVITGEVCVSEGKQLLIGDIPWFSAKVDSCEVHDVDGRRVSKIAIAPAERANRHVLRTRPGSLESQVAKNLVSEVLGTFHIDGAEELDVARTDSDDVPQQHVEPDEASAIDSLATAALIDAVVQKFGETAFLSEHDATWIGMVSSNNGNSVRLAPSGTGIFDGLAGIGLGLASAYATTANDMALALTKKCLTPVAIDLERWCNDRRGPLGAFSGAGGLAYSLFTASKLLGEDVDQWLDLVRRYVLSVRDPVSEDDLLDVSAGAAGAAAVLAALLESRAPFRDDCLTALAACVERLRRRATSLVGFDGLCWPTGELKSPLGGFSHGAAGVGWAIARSLPWLNSSEDVELAARALRFDDNYWDRDHSLWLDARPESANHRVFPVHWCHGATGIFLARFQASQISSELIPEASVERARHAVISNPMPRNDCLCHGALGNAMCLSLDAASQDARNYMRASWNRITHGKFRHGLGFPAHTVPGLMFGYAGLLHGLSWAINSSVPGILWLGATDGA